MRCKEIAIRTAKKKDFPNEDVVELTVEYGGRDLKVHIHVGDEALWVRDVEGARAGEGVILRFDEHVAFEPVDAMLGLADPVQPERPSMGTRGERQRRTDDGTYPNVGEELEKVDRRAKAGERKVGYGRGVTVTSDSDFVPGLGPTHPHNESVAEAKGLVYDAHCGVYRNLEGAATHDKQGQILPTKRKP